MARLFNHAWAFAGIVFASGTLAAKPPELPSRPTVDGKVPTVIEQEHFLNQQLAEPKLLPASILDNQPTKNAPPTAHGAFVGQIITTTVGLQMVRLSTDATTGGEFSRQAESKVKPVTITRFGDVQTAEPPFAEKTPEVAPDLSAIQLKVLTEAARQFREAVTDGNKTQIEQTGKMLDAVLKQLKK